MGPARYRTIAVITIRMVNGSTTISFTTSRNGFRLGIFVPILVCGFLRSIHLLSRTVASFSRGYTIKVGPGARGVDSGLGGSLVAIATLGPRVNCRGTTGITGATCHRGVSLGTTTIGLNFLSRSRFSGVFSFRGVIWLLGTWEHLPRNTFGFVLFVFYLGNFWCGVGGTRDVTFNKGCDVGWGECVG